MNLADKTTYELHSLVDSRAISPEDMKAEVERRSKLTLELEVNHD